MKPGIDCGHATHTGLLRAHNEDSLLVDAGNGLYIVADGMGGHGSGDLASRVAVETIAAQTLAGMTLSHSIIAADQAIAASAAQGDGSPQMGTTVVALRLDGRDFCLAWVGDSRAYRIRGEIEQLSCDHSLVQELIDQGLINLDEARRHPRRNVITRAVGRLEGDESMVDTSRGSMQPGDCIVLCTDGLNGLVSDEEILNIARDAGAAQPAADALLAAALEAGGRDNIAVIVLRF